MGFIHKENPGSLGLGLIPQSHIRLDKGGSFFGIGLELVLGGINEPSVRSSTPSTLSSWAA